MNDCIFCKIVNGEIPSYKVYEDEKVLVFLDINPNSKGECLIIPKNHYTNIIDMDLELLNYINTIIIKIYDLLKSKLNCTGLTLVQNNDYGQEIKHYHIHLMPRYENEELKLESNKDLLEDLETILNKIKKEN